MKIISACLLVGVALVGVRQAVGEITSVAISSASGDSVVTIDYVLTGDPTIVTADILTNEVSVGAAACSSMVGDVNRLVEPGTRRIVWLPRQSWPNRLETTPVLKAALTTWAATNPPPVMAVWLWQNRKVNWYASAASLPGGLTNALYRENCLVMARIPAGGVTWRMGTVPGEETLGEDPVASIRLNNEQLHYVTLTNDFYMGVYPITQGQWRMITGSFTRQGNFDVSLPANGLSYNALRGSTADGIDWPTTGRAVASSSYLGRLRAKTGLAFDLPTDAEWEFACRAGCAGPFFNGKDASQLGGMAWFQSNSGDESHPVGEKEPNAWGLYDMVGNVSAWCLDWIEKPMSATAVTAPVGMATGTERARRGGQWNSPRCHLRSGLRGSDYPNDTSAFFGARLVMPLHAVLGL